MKTAVTTLEPNLETKVHPQFGRCAYFLIIDTDTMKFEAVENQAAALAQGAGIQSAQLLADRGVEAVLTGHCGPKAHATLTAAGIGVFPGCSGAVREEIERFKKGERQRAATPDVQAHSGLADQRDISRESPRPESSPEDAAKPAPAPVGDPGACDGQGMGRGRGRGGGRGRGRGRGQGQGCGGGQGRGRGGRS